MVESSRIVVAGDSRAAERILLQWVEDRIPQRPPATPPRPLRIVVPSHSLRLHLQARLLARRPAWLGLEVGTLRAVARSILVAGGEAPPRGASLLPILLERAASGRRPLAAAFAEFTDGWSALVAAARDLVDAGFEPQHASALLERIEAERPAVPERTLQRAAALVESLAEALVALDRLGAAPDAALHRLATARLAQEGAAALPSSAILIHGFADATGAATDLLEALVRHAGAAVTLVEPGFGLGTASLFGARLRERLESAGGRARVDDRRSEPARVRRLVSATPAREARALAAAVRGELDGGRPPEEIAIVYRDPGVARAALRRELERRGVPFSGSAACGPSDPSAHRARAVLRLLAQGGETPVDVALDGLRDDPALAPEHRAGIRLALRTLGRVRLGEAAREEAAELPGMSPRGFALPVRSGLASGEDGAEVAPRRYLPERELRIAIDRLRAILRSIEGWPRTGVWEDHATALGRLLRAALPGDDEGRDRLLGAVARAAAEIPPGLELTLDEARSLFAELWRAEERVPWGGSGAGVQLLSVTEARGCTWDLLFVGGLARGRFPRAVGEDPLLPDPLRVRLRELLPDLPVKGEGHDEESFLFAQLIGAASDVVLGRPAHDEEGRPLPESPLLEALERAVGVAPYEPLPRGPAPALERATEAAVARGIAGLAPELAPALDEGRLRFTPAALLDVEATAAARLRVLEEWDNDLSTVAGRARIAALGPYFGFTGERAERGPIAATTLEAHARCGWRAFLERRLQLEPTPDPLEAMPWIDAALLGSAVHAALASLFEAAGDQDAARPLETRLDAAGRDLRWPDPDAVAAAARSAAIEALERAGIAGHGLERLLVQRVLDRLAVARSIDEASMPARFLGAELEGLLRLDDGSGGEREIRFRADRLHRERDLLVLTDFKTGRVPKGLDAKQPSTRHDHLIDQVRSGERLQAAIYAQAVAPRAAEARYLFLDPDDDAPEPVLALAGGEETARALATASTALLRARRFGVWAPRLLAPRLDKEYPGCAHCRVAEACIRGDSGFRLRLERWHARELDREGQRSELEETAWRLWRLPAADEEPA